MDSLVEVGSVYMRERMWFMFLEVLEWMIEFKWGEECVYVGG